MASEVIIIIRDWSELSPELIERIAGTLNSITDYVIFGSVCKSWRSAARSISPPRQSPWLYSINYSANLLQLHDPWKPGIQNTYTFPIPLDHEEYTIYGSAYGCFLVYEDVGIMRKRISLFNPLLPEVFWFTLPLLPKDSYGRATCVTDLSDLQLLKYGDGSYCVMYNSKLNDFGFGLFCWRSGDPSWTKLYQYSVKHCTFYKGRFYLLDYTYGLVVVDASDLTITSRIPIPDFGKEGLYPHLVESSSGELLVVAIDGHHINHSQVMQVDLSKKPPALVEVKCIGDDSLFITRQSVICFPVTKSQGLKRNCIYYTDGRLGGPYRLYSTDIGDGSTKAEPIVHEEVVNWHIPTLSSIYE